MINIFAISISLLTLSRDLTGVRDVSASRINQLRGRPAGDLKLAMMHAVLCLKDAQFY